MPAKKGRGKKRRASKGRGTGTSTSTERKVGGYSKGQHWAALRSSWTGRNIAKANKKKTDQKKFEKRINEHQEALKKFGIKNMEVTDFS